MKQLILIIPSVSVKINVEKCKELIRKYVGTRMLDDDQPCEEMPGLVLKDIISSTDKECLQDLVFPSSNDGVLAFIEFDENQKAADLKYLNATLSDVD